MTNFEISNNNDNNEQIIATANTILTKHIKAFKVLGKW